MLLTIFCLLLILGIVFYQSLQGLYSSLIMALATVAATLVAFSFYEPLAAQVYKSQPLYADAASLLVLMVIPLFILRTLLDRFLPGNVVPSVWVDRIGGGIFGLVTAMLLVGTFAVALQMLPWGRSVMGYDPYDDNLARKDTFFMLDAPGFTLGTVKFLSAGSLHGNENFATLHDDLNMEMWGARNRWELGGGEQARRYGQDEVKIPSIVRGKVTPGSLSVISVYDATTAQMSGGKTFGIGAPVWPLEPQAAEGRSRVFIAHVNIDRDAQDDDKWWRLMGTQFRLVTRDGASFYPVGYLMKKDGLVIAEDAVGNLKLNRPGGRGQRRQGLRNPGQADRGLGVPHTQLGRPGARALVHNLPTRRPGTNCHSGREHASQRRRHRAYRQRPRGGDIAARQRQGQLHPSGPARRCDA